MTILVSRNMQEWVMCCNLGRCRLHGKILANMFYSVTLITMFVLTCTAFIGDPLSGNGCGSLNHI